MGIANRLLEVFEERTGVVVRSAGEYEQLQESNVALQRYRMEADELAYHALDYFSGRAQEMRSDKRKQIAQRSRVAFMRDPLAGAEVDLLTNFAFGKGIGKPKAADEDVQKIIDEAWGDPNNMDELTGFDAQRALSNDLKTQANLFVLLFAKNGRVRVTFLDADTVTDVVPDPESRRRPLWYVARTQKVTWDFEKHIASPANINDTKITYYEHWRNVAEARKAREVDNNLEPIKGPKPDQVGAGKVYHVRINRLSEQHFGIPPFQRSLRFYSAMNQFTEARVTMAKAAASFVAKRVIKGTPKQIAKAAQTVLTQSSELAQTDFTGIPDGPSGKRGAPGPFPPGSHWIENEQDRLEALNLSSGSSDAQGDAQIIRAPLAASSGFGQHYLGDASNANLATATTLELPVLMMVGAWQETFEQLYRWFIDRVIEEAVRAGRLGGSTVLAEGQSSLAGLTLGENKAEMENSLNKDLSYEFSMPYPGRRNLPDVVSAVQSMAASFDPNGQNVPLRRALLAWGLRHGFDFEDPSSLVEEAIPDVELDVPDPTSPDPAATGGPSSAAPTVPVDDKSQYGEKRKSTAPEDVPVQEQEWLPPELRSEVVGFSNKSAGLFEKLVSGVAVVETLKAGESANSGSGG